MIPLNSGNNFLQDRLGGLFKWFAKSIGWIIWEFFGIHYVVHKLKPIAPDQDQKEKPPVTAGLWIIGFYIALFGLVFQRYQSKISIIENRINNINTGLSTPGFKQAINRIPETQNMPCPVEPDLFKFWKTFASFLGVKSTYKEGVLILKRIIENWKDSLSDVNLVDADLEGANLARTDLRLARLKGAFFKNVISLYKAQLDPNILSEIKAQWPEKFATIWDEKNKEW
jgi:hypothetical protein